MSSALRWTISAAETRNYGELDVEGITTLITRVRERGALMAANRDGDLKSMMEQKHEFIVKAEKILKQCQEKLANIETCNKVEDNTRAQWGQYFAEGAGSHMDTKAIKAMAAKYESHMGQYIVCVGTLARLPHEIEAAHQWGMLYTNLAKANAKLRSTYNREVVLNKREEARLASLKASDEKKRVIELKKTRERMAAGKLLERPKEKVAEISVKGSDADGIHSEAGDLGDEDAMLDLFNNL